MTDKDFRDSLGELSDEEIAELREGLRGEEPDPAIDGSVDRLLRRAAEESVVAEDEVPPLPDKVVHFFESRKDAALAEVAKEEAALDESVYSQPRRAPEEGRPGLFSRLRLPLGLGGLAAAAAAVALVLVFRGGGTPGGATIPVAYAGSVSLLTPGEDTGFTEPVFTWKADNGGVVDLEIAETGSGRTVGSLDRAFSPLRWSALGAGAVLEPGKSYEVHLTGDGEELASRTFRTSEGATGAPAPEDSIDGVVRQCEELLADNRHADAWMLWGELTDEVKSDPRMQELRTRILAVIAS